MNLLYLGTTSVCLEREGHSPYYAEEGYTVLLDGRELFSSNTNVFSVFDLKPDTAYEIGIVSDSGARETLAICTRPETCCINVRDFGAVGDGLQEDTAAIQTAIDMMPEGARLLFPEGIYLTLPLTLKSHTTLDIPEGSALLAVPDRSRYQVIPTFTVDPETGRETPFCGFEGLESPRYQSFLHASYAEDIAVVGRGRINGSGREGGWWKDFRSFPAARGSMFFCNRCDGVTLHGITVENSPSWNLHPYYSKNISILDCRVRAPKDSPNTDAIDPESCDGVNIIGCVLTVGDDCIAVKSGKLETANKYPQPADHHVIRNCLMQFGHGAVTLGSELSAGIQNLSVTQCCFEGTDRGLRIKSRRGRGKNSLITNVLFDNIRMDHVLTPLVVNMWYNCVDPDRNSEYVWSREKLPIDDRTPHIGSLAFRNMKCTNAEAAACYIDGLPESQIDAVTLENISISFAENAQPFVPAMQNFAEKRCRLGLYLDNVTTIRIRGVSLSGVDGDKILANHYETLDTDDTDDTDGKKPNAEKAE